MKERQRSENGGERESAQHFLPEKIEKKINDISYSVYPLMDLTHS